MPLQPLTKEQRRFRQAEVIADLEKTPEFGIINSIVTSPANGAGNAVQEIVDITTASQDDEDSNHVYDTACSVLEVASRTVPEKQSKLLEFVNELQQRVVKDSKTGEPRRIDGEDLLWTELPTFGYTFGDELQSKGKLLTLRRSRNGTMILIS
jgi:dihydropteroate synthase